MNKNNENTTSSLSKHQIDSVIALYSSGKFNEAIESIQILNVKYPNVPLLFNILGVCYKAKGELEISIDMFNRAISIKPDYAEVHNNMGLTFLALKKLEDASNSFKNATKYLPNFYAAYYNHAIVQKKMGNLNSEELE